MCRLPRCLQALPPCPLRTGWKDIPAELWAARLRHCFRRAASQPALQVVRVLNGVGIGVGYAGVAAVRVEREYIGTVPAVRLCARAAGAVGKRIGKDGKQSLVTDGVFKQLLR